MGHQVLLERLQGLLVPAIHSEQELLLLHVHHQGDVLLAPLRPGLVHPDPAHLRHVHPGPGILHVVIEQSPEPGVVLPDQSGGLAHRHRTNQHHQQGLEHQGEPGPRPRPRDLHLLDPILVALAAWDPGRQVAGVLEEVHVPPGLLLGVVDLAGLAADRTWKVRPSPEVDKDVQPVGFLLEFEVHDLPGGLQTQSHGEECFRIHGPIFPGPSLSWKPSQIGRAPRSPGFSTP